MACMLMAHTVVAYTCTAYIAIASRSMFLQRTPLTVSTLETLGLHLDSGVAVYEFTRVNTAGAGIAKIWPLQLWPV